MSTRVRLVVWVAACVVLAFWVRLQFIQLYGGNDETYLTWARQHYFGGLSEFYLAEADGLRRGEPYVETVYPPGYPLLLAAGKVLGCETPKCLRGLQAGFDSSTVVPLVVLATYAGLGVGATAVAAFIYAVHPLWAAGSTFLLADALSHSLVILTMLALASASLRRVRSAWVVPGAAIGLSALIRPDLLLLIAPAAVWCAWASDAQRITKTLVLLAAFFLTLFPWGLHNRLTHGVWLFTSTGGGATLWQGLGTLPNPHGYVVSDSVAAARIRAAGLKPGTIAADRYMKHEYFAAVVQHPGHAARVVLDRWAGILTTSERLQPLFFGRLREFVDVAGAIVWLIAAVLACHRRVLLMAILLPVVYALISVGVIYYEPRYIRYTHVGYLFAALSLGGWVGGHVSARWPRTSRVAAAVLVVASSAYTWRELATLASLAQNQ